MRLSVDTISEKGLGYQPRKSTRHPALHVTDADFADDIALLAGSLSDAQALLSSLESAANCIGLYLNENKTEHMTLNTQDQEFQIKTLNDKVLKCVDDYKYLGSYIRNSERDFTFRKGLAWSACNKMDKIWKSNLDKHLKINIFRVTIEPVLLYDSETWTHSTKQQRRLDGCYTRLLRRVQNLSWRNHPTLEDIYDALTRISSTVKKRRVQFSGHCARASEELMSSFVLWKHQSSHKRSRKLTFPDIISRDTAIDKEDLLNAMLDRIASHRIASHRIASHRIASQV